MSEDLQERDVVLSLKPSFKFWYNMFPIVLTTIVVLILVAYLSFGLESPKISLTLLFWYFIIIVVVSPIFIFITKERFKRYYYKFYNDRLVFTDSFIDYSQKEITYINMQEVTMHQTFVQRFFDIGTIHIYTSAENGSRNGIYLQNIYNVKTNFELVKEVLKK